MILSSKPRASLRKKMMPDRGPRRYLLYDRRPGRPLHFFSVVRHPSLTGCWVLLDSLAEDRARLVDGSEFPDGFVDAGWEPWDAVEWLSAWLARNNPARVATPPRRAARRYRDMQRSPRAPRA